MTQSRNCELCGHVFAQKHRLYPGQWGGTYEADNVVLLCPNHHAATHFVMRWYYLGADPMKGVRRRTAYAEDRPFWVFWLDRVRPVVRSKMGDEGRWRPHFSPPFSYPAAEGQFKQDWLDRGRRIVEDDDHRQRLMVDTAYLESVFGDELKDMTPEELRRHPFVESMDESQFSMILGYFIGSGVFREGNGYPASFMAQ